ncbi:MAG: signal peptidase I [Longimicrobiales bacterium]|nr:signal peptidase I [Longimicrobiales bacterium]
MDDGTADSGGAGVPPRRDSVREWLRTLLLALVLFLALRTMGVEAFKIPTGSMESTILVGDFVLVNKAVYGARIPGTDLRLPALAEPRRGDVVVFRPPHEPGKNYVKRVVALPGDTVQMRDKELIVNGEVQHERWARYIDARGDAVHPDMEWQSRHLVASPSRYAPSRDTWGPIVVPPDRFFVLGDNRDNSEDSRYWGFVEREGLRGRPWIVYFSLDRSPGEGERGRVRWSRIGHRIR